VDVSRIVFSSECIYQKQVIVLPFSDDDPQLPSPEHSGNIKKVKLPLQEIFFPPGG